MSKHNKALSSRLLDELWNQKNLAIVDELVAENYVEHTLFFPGGISGTQASELQGSDALKALASSCFTLFSTLQIVIMDQIAEGDKVSTRFTWDGTAHPVLHPEEPPDQAKVMGVSIDRIVDGKIVETCNLFDALYRLKTA